MQGPKALLRWLQELSEYKTRLHELESKFGHDSRQVHEAEEQIEHKFGKENVA